jgi:hypothetical protein
VTLVSKPFKLLILVIAALSFSSLAYAQENRLGFSLGMGFGFSSGTSGTSLYPAPALPTFVTEIGVTSSLGVRLQLAPFILLDTLTAELKYQFLEAGNTPYIAVGGGIGLYFMAGIAPIVTVSVGYQFDLTATTRLFVELFAYPFPIGVGPRVGVITGLTFRL